MFQYSGIWNGEAVSEIEVTGQQLAQHFKLPIGSENMVFSLHKSQIKKKDGQDFYSRSRLMQTVINGVYKGSPVTIRYYISKVLKPQSGASPAHYVFNPPKVSYTNKTMTVDPGEDLDKAVFFFLHRWCGESPLRMRGDGTVYNMIDVAGIAKANLAGQVKLQSLGQEIVAMDPREAMYIAKGIRIKDFQIDNSKLTTADAAKFELIQMLNRFPNDFEAAFKSHTVRMKGMIRAQIDEGKIASRNVGAGVTLWYYTEGDKEIVRCKPGSDTYQTLFDHLSNPENHDTLFAKEEKTIEDMVKEGIEKQVIVFDALQSKAFLVQNGTRQSNALMVIKDPDNWETELLNLNKIQTGRLKAAL